MRRAFSPDERAEGPAVGGYCPVHAPEQNHTAAVSSYLAWGLARGPGLALSLRAQRRVIQRRFISLRLGPCVCEGYRRR